MIGKRSLFASLRNPGCTQCALHASSVNVCVWGRGNPKTSPIVLIGEAPGEAEAETGKPFMGRSGQLLQKILNELGIANECYITNICKCRPPDNRTPTPFESRTCTQIYLQKELAFVKPKVVVLLGNTAIKTFLAGGFTRHQAHEFEDMQYSFKAIPTWHPAYCLRSGKGATRQLCESLKLAKRLCDGT